MSEPTTEKHGWAGLLEKNPWMVFLLPFIVFMVVTSLEPTPEHSGGAFGLVIPYASYPWAYTAKIVLTIFTVAAVWPGYRQFPFRVSPLAIVVGALLLVGGIAQLVFAFQAGSFGEGLLTFILGALTVVAGAIVIAQPGVGLATLTLFLAAYFIIEGIFEAIWAFQIKPVSGWGWSLFSGIVSLLLGIMIWSQFPLSGAWAVGVLVGIKLIFSGWTLIILGGAARSRAKEMVGAA